MITNLRGILERAESNFHERAAFRVKTGREDFKEITYGMFIQEVKALGTALIHMDLKDKHVAVLSENRYEWIVSYLAVTCAGAVAVPIDRDLTEDAILYLLEAGDVSAVIYSKTYEGMMRNANLPLLKYGICFEGTEKEEEWFLSYEKIIGDGEELLKSGDSSFAEVELDGNHTAGILYTSGTTGFSKGVMLTHKNIASNIVNATYYDKYREHEIMLSVLPYHHSFECTVGLLASLYYGATICINDSLKYLAKNMILFKPTAMFLVPAIIYAMYRRIQEAEKNIGRTLTPEEAGGVFGGRLSRIISGSAPLEPTMIRAFYGYGIRLCQGYGLTETSPVVTSTDYDKIDDKNITSVGQVIPGCEVRIEQGEIWIKGDNVMCGYYKNAEATQEAFEDGWFKTGDLGYLEEENFLYINGRKKNVIIASGGENVYPEEIEQHLYKIPIFSDALVYGGDSGKNDIVTAVIYPNYELLQGKSEEEVAAAVKDEVQNVNERLSIYKQILEIKIRKTPFEKTTSNKIKRNEANTRQV